MGARKLPLLLLIMASSSLVVSGAGKRASSSGATSSATAVPGASTRSQVEDRRRALHALNRLTFGPRPGDLNRVQGIGVEKWIDQQLHPERIADAQLESRLASFRTLGMEPRELVENFPPPQLIRAVAEGRVPMPTDPEKRAIYEAQIQRYRNRQQRERRSEAGQDTDEGTMSNPMVNPSERAVASFESLMRLPADERTRAVARMSPEIRRALFQSLDPEQRRELLQSIIPQRGQGVAPLAAPQQVVAEVAQAKLLRTVYSERQLEEVLTDFWFNHFNVFIGKGPDRYLVTSYERDVIRPHVLGKFKDLLAATASSPAMLFYLDNWQSVGPNSPLGKNEPIRRGLGRRRFGQRPQNPSPGQDGNRQQQVLPRGLNENYARELMELHTLGVEGGYTQKDVTEVARVFTGWSIRQPRRGGGFGFNRYMHEPGIKTVLGKTIKESGQKEGLQVLQMLARHPSTAHFISTKLAQRFVADDPPENLVDRMSITFIKTDGDIREVLRAMFRSPEFWSPETYRSKVKTPLEFVASALRSTGAEVTNALPTVQTLNRMGMPLYGAQPPTGYSNKSSDWVNSAALLNRLNFALALSSGQLPGTQFEPQRLAASNSGISTDVALEKFADALLAGGLSSQTRETIQKQLESSSSPAGERSQETVVGLILGAPEFQRR